MYYTENTLYNKEENKFWCVLDAHNKDAVIKHHQKDGLKCDCITEVKTTHEKVFCHIFPFM
ncbi:MAG: nickel-binding protein [Nitrososphaera sp.]